MINAIFLAQFLGIAFFVTGLASIIKRSELEEAVNSFRKSKPLPFVVGLLEFLLGVWLVLLHNVWGGPAFAVVITVILWLMILEGLCYMFLPHGFVTLLIKKFNRPAWYKFGGLVWVLVGIYLVGKGFGWF